MPHFMGEYERVNVDPKGRINIPSSFRRTLSPEARETFVVSMGYDGCLAVRPLDEWNKFADEIRRLSTNEKKARQYIRTVVSRASEAKIDSHGRITVPKTLLDKVGIDGSVTVIGALDWIELWDPEKFEDYMKDADKTLEEVAEQLDFKNKGGANSD